MEALPPLRQINSDVIPEDTELHESVDIKEDFTEDMLEENSDPTNVNMSPNQEEDSDSKPPENELEVGDFPIIRIPTTLSENEMLEIFKKHNFAFDGQYTCESELANKLQYAMKTYHPLSRILKKVSIVKISNLHDFILGHQAHENNTSPGTRLGEHYFKKHWKSPLTSFLKDMKRFDLATTWQEMNVGKIPKEDPSIVVDPGTSRSKLIEDLKYHGHHDASIQSSEYLTNEKLRERLKETLRCKHPIHKVIGRLDLEDVKALICYAGHYSKVYGSERYKGKREDIIYPRLLSKIIFESKPEAPISYLTQIQNVYKNNGPEGHAKALEKFRAQQFKIQLEKPEDTELHESVDIKEGFNEDMSIIPEEDLSIVVDPLTSRSQLIEELKSHGHNNAFDYADFTQSGLTNKYLREKLEETLRCTHPIHKVIGRLDLEDMKALICYAGHYSKVYGRERYTGKREDIMYPRLLSKIIFESKPEAPISYLTQIHNVYRNNGPEGHRKALEKFRTEVKEVSSFEFVSVEKETEELNQTNDVDIAAFDVRPAEQTKKYIWNGKPVDGKTCDNITVICAYVQSTLHHIQNISRTALVLKINLLSQEKSVFAKSFFTKEY